MSAYIEVVVHETAGGYNKTKYVSQREKHTLKSYF